MKGFKDYFNSYSHPAAPADCIRAMQADTKGGILRLWFPLEDDDEVYDQNFICKMNWSTDDAEKLIAEYEQLYADLAEIAGCYGPKDDLTEKNAAVQADPRLSAVWDVYLRPFKSEKFDSAHISEILKKLDYNPDINVELTAEEDKLLDLYLDAEASDFAGRIGGGVCAYEIVWRARDLCQTMMKEKTSQNRLNHAASILAAAMALHAYCTEMEEFEPEVT